MYPRSVQRACMYLYLRVYTTDPAEERREGGIRVPPLDVHTCTFACPRAGM